MERLSTHPLARAITRHGKQHQLAPLALEHFESITGLGLCAQHGAKTCWLGRRELVLSKLPRGAQPTAPAPITAMRSGRPATPAP